MKSNSGDHNVHQSKLINHRKTTSTESNIQRKLMEMATEKVDLFNIVNKSVENVYFFIIF